MAWIIALFLLSAATGIWLSRSGRPLKTGPSAVHKLLSVGLAVLAAIGLFGGAGFGSLPAVRQVMGIVGLAALVSLFATGAVLSGKDRKKPLVALHVIAAMVVLVCIVGWALSPKQITLSDPTGQVRYRIEDSSSITYDSQVSRAELIKRDLIHYGKEFGRIDNAQDAAIAAAYVHEEIYGAPSGDYIVSFNDTASVWIVYDELPDGWLGGCGMFAITKDTGEIIMGYHGQ